MMRMTVRVISVVGGGLGSLFTVGLLHVTVDEAHVEFMSVRLRSTRVEKTHSRFLHYKNEEPRAKPGQDSPFWTLETGGCIKSLKGPRASFRAELTSDDEHVMHSTSVGYRAIT